MFKKLFWRIYSKILRISIRYFPNPRPSSYPYLTGDGLRSIADHIYDELQKCNPKDIGESQVVFLKTDLVEEWFTKVHQDISVNYKLITHNSDNTVGEKETRYIDQKIIRWFAQNNIYKHEKITPIPIGIENKKWFMSGWILWKKAAKLIAKNSGKAPVNGVLLRKPRILFGFNPSTNPEERGAALKALNACPSADAVPQRLIPADYFELLDTYDFVASPEGNGPDCMRTWEALILNIIPIVKNTSDNQIISQNDFPIWVIKDWNDIVSVSEKQLEEIYNKYDLSSKSGITRLDYWEKIIRTSIR